MTAMFVVVVGALLPLAADAASVSMQYGSKCGDMKDAYRAAECCGAPSKVTNFQVVPFSMNMFRTDASSSPLSQNARANPCYDKKPVDGHSAGDRYFDNINCSSAGQISALEQAGVDVSDGVAESIDTSGSGHVAVARSPILSDYFAAGLCPVNVHWHLGAEHRHAHNQVGFDENGRGPATRRLSSETNDDGYQVRLGNRCYLYDGSDVKFTTEYDWKHCIGMVVGETYEVHWPHSAAGACHTPHQYQSPFYDGVFCRDGVIALDPLNVHETVGVQAQVFTIVNDETYYYPDLMRGWITETMIPEQTVYYTGSTTGTSRNNEVCSQFTPITWQVDRVCKLISASSFDKMCADMKQQADDMSSDLHAHGARETVLGTMAADNQHAGVSPVNGVAQAPAPMAGGRL